MRFLRANVLFQLLTQSQRALSNIHTHLSSLDRNALTQFPKAEVCWFKKEADFMVLFWVVWSGANLVHVFGSVPEVAQGGSADPQRHRGQLPPVGGAAELQRSEQGKGGRGASRAQAPPAGSPPPIVFFLCPCFCFRRTTLTR